MKSIIKKTAIAAAAVAVITAGASPKHANRPAPAGPATQTKVAVLDSDTVQQGDQTAPDTAAPAAPKGSHTSDPTDHRGSRANGPEQEQGTETESSNETAGDSDGPGGHQDPPGDVQHEGGANEQ